MGLAAGAVLRVGAGATAQVVTVEALPASDARLPPDPGNVVVTPPLPRPRQWRTRRSAAGRRRHRSPADSTTIALVTAGATAVCVTDAVTPPTATICAGATSCAHDGEAAFYTARCGGSAPNTRGRRADPRHGARAGPIRRARRSSGATAVRRRGARRGPVGQPAADQRRGRVARASSAIRRSPRSSTRRRSGSPRRPASSPAPSSSSSTR